MNSNAKWIEHDDYVPVIYDQAVCFEFRRDFDMEGMPASALLRISGLGFFDAKINGLAVTENLLTPPFTAYDKRVYYEEYDVTQLLKPGANEITVELGPGWYAEKGENAWEFEHAVWHGNPRMIAELLVDDKCILVSDRSWQGRPSATVFSQLREGETFDASADEKPWKSARISRGPGGILEKYEGPGIRVEEILEPVRSVQVGKKTLYDFGVNISGNCEIVVSGVRGSRVRMEYGERIDENDELNRERIAEHVWTDRFQTDEYILAGKGEEVWHSRFTYNGFRYVMVSSEADVIAIRARNFHTELPEAGGFECDNEVLNAIQSAVLRSTKTNFHHMPTDCPHREKNGWTGDAHLSAEQALLNLDVVPAYRKWMRDFRDAQRPGGMLPGIIPTSSWGYNWGNGVSWDCACIVIPWQCYMATGDVSLLTENFDVMEKYVDYMTGITDDHVSTIGLGDWCRPKEAKLMNTPALLTAISIRVYQLMEKICNVTGLGCGEKYALLAKDTTDAFKKYFVGDAPENTPFGTVEDSQPYLSMLLWFSLADDPEDVTKRLAEKVAQADNHILGGIFCAKFLLDALTDNGRFDLACKIAMQRDYPGWFHMLSNGSGTLWEDWAGNSSLNHHMFSPISAWFYKGIAGIRIEEPGYRKVRIASRVPEGMEYFRAWHMTPLGRLEVLWKDGKLTVTAPGAMEVVLDTELPVCIVSA